jgi:hypothetical protein
MLAALALGGLAAAVGCTARNPQYDLASMHDGARPPADDVAPASVHDDAATSVDDRVPASVEDSAPASVDDGAPASVEDAAAAVDDGAPASADDRPLDSEPGDVVNDPAIAPDSNIGSGLVGYWKLDEASGTVALDSSANHNDGALTGIFTAAPWAAGRVGRALSFNPAGRSLVAVSDAPSLNPATLTVAAWANVRDWNGNRRILQKGLTDSEYRLLAESGNMTFHVFGAGVAVAALPASGGWHHYAGTLDGTTLNLYIDGLLVGSATAVRGNRPTADPLYIGGKLPNDPIPTNYFYGGLDEVVIYDRALSPAEVAMLAAGAQPL